MIKLKEMAHRAAVEGCDSEREWDESAEWYRAGGQWALMALVEHLRAEPDFIFEGDTGFKFSTLAKIIGELTNGEN